MTINDLWGSCAYKYKISVESLLSFLKQRAPLSPDNYRPLLGVDVRLGYHGALNSGTDFVYFMNPTNVALRVAGKYQKYIKYGFSLLFVDDNPVRTPSKFRSLKRAASRRMYRPESISALAEFRSMSPYADDYEEKRRLCNKLVRAAGGVVSAEMIKIFSEQVVGKQFKGHAQYMVAAYQADSQLVSLLQRGHISGIISNDVDLVMLGADFVIRSLFESIVEIGSLYPLDWIKREPFKVPVCNIFMKNDSLYTRCIWATILGTDNLPGGTNYVAAKTLIKLQMENNRNVGKVLDAVCRLRKVDVPYLAFVAAAEAHCYEPVFMAPNSKQQCYLDSLPAPAHLFESNMVFKLANSTQLVKFPTDAVGK